MARDKIPLWPDQEELLASFKKENKKQLRNLEDQAARIDKAQTKLRKLSLEKNELFPFLKIQCVSSVKGAGCGTWFPLKEIVFIQTQWCEPQGGSFGGQWYDGDGEFVCPTCKSRNRMYNRDYYLGYKESFKSLVKEQDRS